MGARRWSLAEDGDSLEREWWAAVGTHFPTYQSIWERHVVPLTFRTCDGELNSRFIRPGIPLLLADLADSHYATFYHLALAHAWLKKLSQRLDSYDHNRRSFPTPTECFYCFFAHAISAHDAALHFAVAVNRVLARYGRYKVFPIRGRRVCRSGPWEPTRFESLGSRLPLDDFNELVSRIKYIRNQLLHKHPTYLQNNGMPADMSDTGPYRGLRGIGMLARNPLGFARHFRPVEIEFAGILCELENGLDAIWHVARDELDSITSPSYKLDQERIAPEDQSVTGAALSHVRLLRFEKSRNPAK